MAKKDNITNATRGLKTIKPKTAEMEVFLQAGYPDLSVEKAKAIIEERKANPAAWPYEVYERAVAFLAAYEQTPVAVSATPAWTRSRRGG